VQLADHYRFRRPISDSGVNYVARTYPYGGTAGGSLQVHHGVDMENPRGTPIFAAADGTVFFAGSDLGTLFGPQNNYYGNLVVIQHAFTDAGGQAVFSLYGHMDRVDVTAGQVVTQGDTIGAVGGTGVAFGSHLHFEVRVGDPHSFSATRNPELWIYPYQGYGTLAGRVTDANGTPLYDVTLQVKSTNITRYTFSYADTSVNPDTTFNENFVLGDLPANYYEVAVNDNGRVRFQKIIYVYPNRTTWIDVQLRP
jgi:murein DD-endopeptidase MepM/ murein hydrolase activator NlpD